VHEQVPIEQAAYEEAVRSYQELGVRAQCELDGTCGTGDAGDGAAYQGAKAAADAQAGVVAAAKIRFDGAVTAAEDAAARSVAQAGADLATDEATLIGLTAQKNRLQAAFEATNKDDDGILIRLQALNRLSDRNATLGLAHFMLSLLFICIELLPVLMKVLSNFGPPSAYDRLTALRDGGNLDVEQVQQQARRELEAAQAELLVIAERERVEREKSVILARRAAVDARKAAEEREAAEAREAVEAQEAAKAREAAEARKAARAKRAAETRAAVEAQRAAEAQAAADAEAVAEARRAARTRRAAEARAAAEAKRAADAQAAAEARAAAEALATAAAEARRAAEEQSAAEAQRVAEARRMAEEQAAAEAQRVAEARREARAQRAAEARRAAQAKAAEARRAAEAQRQAEAAEAARAEFEAVKLQLEQQQAAEEGGSWLWDTGPVGFARNAAVRTVKTVTSRIPTGV